jgi:hypothetical protein
MKRAGATNNLKKTRGGLKALLVPGLLRYRAEIKKGAAFYDALFALRL